MATASRETGWRGVALVAVGLAAACSEAPPEPFAAPRARVYPAPDPIAYVATPTPTPAPTSFTVRLRNPPPRPGPARPTRGPLRGARKIELRTGLARLQLADGSVRTLEPGGRFEGHSVVRVGETRIELRRDTSSQGLATVLVTFDEEGYALVVTLATRPDSRITPVPARRD